MKSKVNTVCNENNKTHSFRCKCYQYLCKICMQIQFIKKIIDCFDTVCMSLSTVWICPLWFFSQVLFKLSQGPTNSFSWNDDVNIFWRFECVLKCGALWSMSLRVSTTTFRMQSHIPNITFSDTQRKCRWYEVFLKIKPLCLIYQKLKLIIYNLQIYGIWLIAKLKLWFQWFIICIIINISRKTLVS